MFWTGKECWICAGWANWAFWLRGWEGVLAIQWEYFERGLLCGDFHIGEGGGVKGHIMVQRGDLGMCLEGIRFGGKRKVVFVDM